jgi:methionyl aminopeptidase
MVILRSADELAVMREAGRLVARILTKVAGEARPGVRPIELDRLAADLIASHGAKPSFLDYQPAWAPVPYPGVLCMSVNDAIVHEIPDRRPLRAGDLLSIDCGAAIDGYHGDAAVTVAIGEVDAAGLRLSETTRRALDEAIAAARPGARMGDVSAAIEAVGRAEGYGIPVGLGGHGVGTEMHADPSVPNTGRPGRGLPLREGLVIAIEPMFTEGGGDRHRTRADGWTVETTDGSRAAHWEHTIAVTAEGPRILTAL